MARGHSHPSSQQRNAWRATPGDSFEHVSARLRYVGDGRRSGRSGGSSRLWWSDCVTWPFPGVIANFLEKWGLAGVWGKPSACDVRTMISVYQIGPSIDPCARPTTGDACERGVAVVREPWWVHLG